MTYPCPRQMEHKAYVAQPASVRHQGKPFPTKDLRIGAQAIDKKSQTSTKADGLSCRTVARNSLKPAKKDREQEILLFPVLHPSPVPQPLPHEQRRGPSASEKPSMSPALSSSPIKVFGKDGGELEGGRETFFQKGSPFPPHPKTSTSPTRSSRNAWSSPHRAGRARGLPERRGNP